MLQKAEAFNNEDPKFILRSKRIQYSVIILAQYLSAFILAPEKSPDHPSRF
jgi:hypothetical protein